MTKEIRESRSRGQITIPVPPDLKAQLETLATSERRTLSNFVRNILASAVEPRKGVAQ
jgi:predicted transcriptional regulator